VEWRSNISYGPLVDYLVLEARCADLILTGAAGKRVPGGPITFDAGALVLQAGRPVLVVPASTTTMKLGKIVVCWRDTRECRRAVVDAMDFLKQAGAVDVIEVTIDDDMPACRARLDDVVAWLALHGVAAVPVATSTVGDEKATLAAIIGERQGDIVVAGAYGHSRLHEWVLGGVTRDLWMQATHCSLLSH
jgi:nucleotide-binding universal stress UspA family protein